MNSSLLLRLFPFLAWFPVSTSVLRGDLIAGITGALVLVPKAMAYATICMTAPVRPMGLSAAIPSSTTPMWLIEE